MNFFTWFRHTVAVAGIAVLAVVGHQANAANEPITTWTFESPNTPPNLTDNRNSPSAAADFGTGTATGFHSDPDPVTTDWSTPAGNGSIESFSANTWAVGDYWQFQTSTTGFDDIGLYWEQTGSNTGPRDFQVSWSTDNITYTPAGSVYTLINAAWSSNPDNRIVDFTLYSLDLSSITALDNAATAYFRLVSTSTTSIEGLTVAATGTSRVDNFSVVRDYQAPPPPPPRELPIAGDIVFGLNHGAGARTVELVRGPADPDGGVQIGSPWFTTKEIGSIEFDNKDGVLHNVAGNLLGIDEGSGPTNGGDIYNFATQGDPESFPAGVMIGNTRATPNNIGQTGSLTTTRLSGLSVAPDNSKIAVAGMNSGRVIVYDYTAGNSLGGPSSGALLQDGRQSAQVLAPSILDDPLTTETDEARTYRYGTAWVDNDTVLTFNVPSPGVGQIISVDDSNSLATNVEETLTVPGIGGEHFTALAYNPDVSPYVYAMFSTYEGASGPPARNKLFILDPAADADPFNVLGQRELDELDQVDETTNQTAKEISLDAAGNLFIGAFASEIYFIEDVVTDPSTIGTAQLWYSSAAFSFDTGIDIGFAAPGIPGDYNDDGVVDAADGVVQTKFAGTDPNPDLPNDPTDGVIGNAQRTTWITNFGEGAGGSGGTGQVPEPAGFVMLAIGLAGLSFRRRGA